MTTPQDRITYLMHRAAEQAAPDDLDLWPAVIARLRPYAATAARRRTGWISLAAALAVLVVVLAALALRPHGGSDPVHVASLGGNLTPTVSPETRVTPADTRIASQATPAPAACYVAAALDSIKVRAEPDSNADAVGTVFNQGALMEISERRDAGGMGWYRVHVFVPMPAGYVDGWVRAEQVNGPFCGAQIAPLQAGSGQPAPTTRFVPYYSSAVEALLAMPEGWTPTVDQTLWKPDLGIRAESFYANPDDIGPFDPAIPISAGPYIVVLRAFEPGRLPRVGDQPNILAALFGPDFSLQDRPHLLSLQGDQGGALFGYILVVPPGWNRDDAMQTLLNPLIGTLQVAQPVDLAESGSEIVLDAGHRVFQLRIAAAPQTPVTLHMGITGGLARPVEARLVYASGEPLAAFNLGSVSQLTVAFAPLYLTDGVVPVALYTVDVLAPGEHVTLSLSRGEAAIPPTPTPGSPLCTKHPLYCVPLAGGGSGPMARFETPDSRPLDAPSRGAPGVVRGVTADGAPFLGSPAAPIRFLAFLDLECAHCWDYHDTDLRRFIEDYVLTGQAVLEVRLVQVVGRYSRVDPAQLAYCAGAQGAFWEMTDFLFTQARALGPQADLDIDQARTFAEAVGMDPDRIEQCLRGGIYDDMLAANKTLLADLGVTGVPTVLAKGGALIDWTRVPRDYDTLKTLTESAALQTGASIGGIIPEGRVAVSVIASDSYEPGAPVDVFVTMAFVNVDDTFQAPADPGKLPTLAPHIITAPPSGGGDAQVITRRVIENAVVVLNSPLADGSGDAVLTLAVSPQDAVVLTWALDADLPVSIAPHSGE